MTRADAGVGELLEKARDGVDSGWLPSCQIAVARDGALLVFETFGDATPDTAYCIFSVTKPLVASAVWLLIGDGALEVDRPVAHYIPEFATNGKEAVTVEQVMLHTSGFPMAPMGPTEGADPSRRTARFSTWMLDWEPGSRFEYHPLSAHWVLADLIGRLSGIDFRSFIAQRICTPLSLPQILGNPAAGDIRIAPMTWVGAGAATEGPGDLSFSWDDPEIISAGAPGAGGVATAADIALFYQALLTNPGRLWNETVLADATSKVRCTFPDPFMGVPVNRTLGLVVAGDDGLHTMRYGAFAQGNSPRAFGHAGAHVQVAWADPETGISFSYLTNGLDTDTMREGIRGLKLSNIAAQL